MAESRKRVTPPRGLGSKAEAEWWRALVFQEFSKQLSTQISARVLNEVVGVPALATSLGWNYRALRNKLFKTAGGKPGNRVRAPFEDNADLARQFVEYAVAHLNSRADLAEDALSSTISAELQHGATLSAEDQRVLAFDVIDRLVVAHARRVASSSWRAAFAIRSLLVGLDAELEDADVPWFGAVQLAQNERERSLLFYTDLYAQFMASLPTMRLADPATTLEDFAHAAAWLTDGYAVRSSIEMIATGTDFVDADEQLDPPNSTLLCQWFRVLVDHFFIFAADGPPT